MLIKLWDWEKVRLRVRGPVLFEPEHHEPVGAVMLKRRISGRTGSLRVLDTASMPLKRQPMLSARAGLLQQNEKPNVAWRAQGWACTQIFEGHSHYVMQCVFNPKDTNTFASASLDRTVKVRPML